jgi:hypothetical protein
MMVPVKWLKDYLISAPTSALIKNDKTVGHPPRHSYNRRMMQGSLPAPNFGAEIDDQ